MAVLVLVLIVVVVVAVACWNTNEDRKNLELWEKLDERNENDNESN